MDNTRERDAELFASYCRYIRNSNTTHAQAVRAAVNSPASRYWVSPNYLYREIVRRRKGETHDERRKLRKSDLYDRLYADYLTIRLRPLCRDLSMEALCDLLVNRPAPSFFLSEKRGDEIIKYYRLRLREREMQMKAQKNKP
jgi:hypothetical protein